MSHHAEITAHIDHVRQSELAVILYIFHKELFVLFWRGRLLLYFLKRNDWLLRHQLYVLSAHAGTVDYFSKPLLRPFDCLHIGPQLIPHLFKVNQLAVTQWQWSFLFLFDALLPHCVVLEVIGGWTSRLQESVKCESFVEIDGGSCFGGARILRLGERRREL